jgi:hypothetical protein
MIDIITLMRLSFFLIKLILKYFFQKVTGKAEEGYPQPEVTLPEGTIPTHLRAITEHKTKMHELGISTVESD